MTNYYPLALQNEWRYKQRDGTTYVNKVIAAEGNEFIMHNSIANTNSSVRAWDGFMMTDALEAGNFQEWLSSEMIKGDNWVVRFKTNGFDSLLVMTVKETNMSKLVEGQTYNNVLFIEAESKMILNGSLLPLNFFTQYYYAAGIGLVLTTSSAGDSHALVDYKLN